MLPRSLDDIRGLRAARWTRESTRGQYDTFGPDAQCEQQDRAIERWGLTDTGLSWTVAHSGRTVAATSQFGEMLAAAGDTYDVLVVGYVSRFARDLRTAVNARHDLHRAGAALLFCDERLLSSDEDAWEHFAREAVEAEAYSRRLGRRVREGFAAKYRRLGDPGGNPPWGFRRGGPAHTLEPDPDTIGEVVRAYERYAHGDIGIPELAEDCGVGIEKLRGALRNPLYNGYARRHRGDELVPAAWREHPPVSDALWSRAQQALDTRSHGGPQRGKYRHGVDPLGGLLYCVCGARIRTNGTAGKPPRRQRAHPRPICEWWGGPMTVWGASHDDPIASQIASLRLDEATIERVVRAIGEGQEPPPLPFDVARVQRRRRELALDHAAGRIADDEYITAAQALRAPDTAPVASAPIEVDAGTAVAYLRDIGRLWRMADVQERADLLHVIYQRVTVTRAGFDGVELTPIAYAQGLAIAMRETVRVVPSGDGSWHLPRTPVGP